MNTGDEITPVQRQRSPYKAASKSKGRDTDQDKKQKEAADRTLSQQEEKLAADRRNMISTKLQTNDVIGKHPAEPDKHREVENAKVGLPGTGIAEDDEEFEVKTIDQKVDGVHVDTIVKPPEGEQVGGAAPLTEGQRVQQVIDEHTK